MAVHFLVKLYVKHFGNPAEIRRGKDGVQTKATKSVDAMRERSLSKKSDKSIAPKAKEFRIIDGCRCQKIDAGKVKQVYKRVLRNGSLDNSKVYYVTKGGMRGCVARRELDAEVRIAKDIQRRLTKAQEMEALVDKVSPDESHIQTSLVATSDGSAIKAPAALGNLDDYLKTHSISEKEAIDIANQIALGMNNLQKAGYVIGDAKLENILIFKENGKLVVRISDFGNAKRISKGQIGVMNSNDRFRSGETILSQESERYSTALMITQVLGFAHRKFSAEPKYTKHVGNVTREGIEGYLLNHGRVNNKGVKGRLRNWGTYAFAKVTGHSPEGTGKRDQETISTYIDHLQSQYCFEPGNQNKDAAMMKMFSTLKEMTSVKVTARPEIGQLIDRIASVKVHF